MRTLGCGMWDLVPWPGIELRPPVLGVWSFSHWTIREAPCVLNLHVSYLVCCCSVTKSCLTLCDPMDYSPPGSSVGFPRQEYLLDWVVVSFSRGSSDPGIEPTSPAFAGRCFTTEPPGKPPTSFSRAHTESWIFQKEDWLSVVLDGDSTKGGRNSFGLPWHVMGTERRRREFAVPAFYWLRTAVLLSSFLNPIFVCLLWIAGLLF